MANGDFESTETILIRNLLKNVDVFINVGANIGYYCCHALSMGKSVIAFEPIERNVRYLCKNIRINGWSDIEIYPIALSDRTGVLDMYGGDTGASVIRGWAGIPASYATYVPSSTMNMVVGSRLRGKRTVVLIDVEGSEKWVVQGATILLSNEPKPVWIIEIVARDHQPVGVDINPTLEDTFSLFFKNKYRCFLLDNTMREIGSAEVELVANGQVSFPTHNFLFCDSADIPWIRGARFR